MTRQYNIQISHKTIFFKYRTKQIKATETNKEIIYLNCNGSLIENMYVSNYFRMLAVLLVLALLKHIKKKM